ncbi:hypothetical protein [Desmospora activa]|uniref:Uncharacterized protein n=1 Tax=Desmospora activa DSM 45169 TaxID=1121389 RepID=A0A2T4Z3J7_9BACL|nr:hypothetical protein [Desmospora activa]PTM56460.1 hypothetical protein C8J48_2782 [Desmospora activa DSM 45169]
MDDRNRANPDITSDILEDERRNKWRVGSALLLLLILSTGITWMGWVSTPIEKPPEVLADTVFNEIIPYREQEDLLYFLGEIGGQQEHYVFDMRSGELKQDDGSHHFESDENVHLLKDGHRLLEQANGKQRRLVVEKSDGTRLVVGSIPAIDQPVSVSPGKDAFIFIGEGEQGWDLTLFRLDTETSKPINHVVSRSISRLADVIQWSSSGKYLLYDDQHLVSAEDGSSLHRLDGSAGVWSPVRDEVAYVQARVPETVVKSEEPGSPVPIGNTLALWNPVSDSVTALYRLPADERILGKPIWDSEGRYLAFPTGKESESEWFFERVHVMDGKGFHYIENEQNVSPTRLTDLTLSPKGKYLSYSVNGILKLINLNTQESRVYDYDFAGEGEAGAGVRFDPDGVWMIRDRGVLFVANNMEEKVVYQTGRNILGFYLSSSTDRLLVLEEMADGHRLRLINLQSDQDNNYE